MKNKLIILFLTISLSQYYYSQNNEFNFESISVSIGSFKPQKGRSNDTPFHSNLQVNTKINKSLISFSLDGMIDFLNLLSLIGNQNRSNIQLGLLYGKEIKIYEWINLETHLGIGYFWETYKKDTFETWQEEYNYLAELPSEDIEQATFGSFSIPIKIKLLFSFSDKSSFGLNFNYSINSVSNFSSLGLVFQQMF